MACRLTTGELEVPGGCIHQTDHWRVEHCIGPLGVGTLIVKPRRHVLYVADLTDEEAEELGPLLRQTAKVVEHLTEAEQVYVTLWSHGPVHIHWVVQPVTATQVEEAELHGPRLQVLMFDLGESPDPVEAATFAERARSTWPVA